ncbi:MAG: glycosyltransferase [Bacteroidales bacterium]
MLSVKSNEKVLVCPLGWGLGHAARVIPIVRSLIAKGCIITIAADESSIDLLKTHFPEVNFRLYPSVNVRLSKGCSQIWRFLGIALKILHRTFTESRSIKQIVNELNIDIIISDNRYGLYHKGIKTVLITHQLWIQFPTPFKPFEFIGRWFVRRYAQRFTECWVPDNPSGFKYSGRLSQPRKLPNNTKYIGLLSRFHGLKVSKQSNAWDLVGIVSGPEPHRKQLEEAIISLSNQLKLKTLVVQGLPQGKSSGRVVGKTMLVPHLNDQQMASALLSSKYIICRSGYSTIMDLTALKLNALLVPTPGQTEQEYLAKHLAKYKLFSRCLQNQLHKLSLTHLHKIIGDRKNTEELVFFNET